MSDWCSLHGHTPLRICTKCGKQALTEKDLELFTKAKSCKFGRSSVCKTCKNNEYKKYYHKKENFEKHRATVHNYYLSHPVESKEKAQRRLKKPNYWHSWYYDHKKECLAREKSGRLIKTLESCSQCSATENLTRHHPDYDKPLEVIILCRQCHTDLHKQLNLEKRVTI